ncbi:RNA polymerase sigma factor SigZ [hydrothermal vent metagenome]|uniref:RNA polymerase sigma factor SigZ n=1 Tax=hydrothermal vent metagenome TaxID=652676 RepID=A0A3B0VUC5_9ZZZZ
MTQITEAIWQQFHDSLANFIRKRISNEADAQDILQDVFVKIHQSVSQLKDETRLTAWVYQITRNVIHDYYRQRREWVELPDGLVDVAADVETAVSTDLTQEVAQWLRPMMAQLSPKQREAIQLVELEGMSQRKMSEQLQLSISGTKSRVQRGRKQLKEVLLACCHVEFDRQGNVLGYQERVAECDHC